MYINSWEEDEVGSILCNVCVEGVLSGLVVNFLGVFFVVGFIGEIGNYNVDIYIWGL